MLEGSSRKRIGRENLKQRICKKKKGWKNICIIKGIKVEKRAKKSGIKHCWKIRGKNGGGDFIKD